MEVCRTKSKQIWKSGQYFKLGSSEISQDHVQAMISEAIADHVQRNFYKIYFFE